LDEKSKELYPRSKNLPPLPTNKGGCLDQTAKARAFGTAIGEKKAAKISRLFQERI
jgi:hypothetical protein